MKKQLVSTILMVCLMLFPSSATAEMEWLDKVLILVEDDVILDSEFKRRLKTIKQQITDSGGDLPSATALEKQVLERLILEHIQLQLAKRSGIRISDAELNAALARIAESSQSTIPDMQAQLEAEGINFALFREDIRNEIMISRVRQGTVSRKIFVSEQEVDDILVLMEGQGALNIQYRLRHLMIAIDESAGTAEVDAAKAKAEDITERTNSGEDFAQMVIAESDGSDALSGGDLGLRTIEQIPTLFASLVSNMEVGDVTAPIRSANGLHLLKLEERKGGIAKQMIDEVHMRHILIRVSTVTSDAKAEAILISVRKEILAGETTFEEQAKVLSEDLASASEGGDLGWAAPQAFESVYRGNSNDLKDGDISEPFKGTNGWYLVKKLESRTTDQTAEVKRMRARRILQSRKFDEEQEAWLREIREQAFVKVLGNAKK